jgi:hypothetical protein
VSRESGPDPAAPAVALGAGVAGALGAAADAAATDEAVRGMDALRDVAERLARVGVEQKKGNLFEYIEATRFNVDAARRGVDARAVVTADVGRPHDPADIELVDGVGRVLRKVQAKASKSTTAEVRMLSESKYDGMDKLVPSDHAETVRRKAALLAERGTRAGPSRASLRDTADRATGQLRHGGASSGGTTLDETYQAAEHPQRTSLQLELRSVAQEAAVTAGQAALAGAVMGGALSVVRETWAVTQGDRDKAEAVGNVAKATAKSSLRSGLVGATSAAVRYGGVKAGVGALTKSNVATASAAALIDVGVTVYAFARGEVAGDVAAERIGRTGCSTLSGVYAGAAAGAVFGPAGAVAGSVVGYMLAGAVYQSCLATLRSGRLAEEEAARVVALCDEAIAALAAERERFEAAVQAHVAANRAALGAHLGALDAALEADDPAAAVVAMADLSSDLGHELKLVGFEEFDRFMTEEDGPLVF